METQTQTDEQLVNSLSDELYEQGMSAARAAVGRPISNPNDPVIIGGLEAIGRICDVPVCTSQIAVAVSLERALSDHGVTYSSGVGAAVTAAVYRDIASARILGEDQSPDTIAVMNFGRLVYDAILFERGTVLIPWPTVWETDADGELHCETGPAIAWGDHQQEHYWHGQEIDAVAIENPGSVTAAYLRELSAEKRRATYEAIGHELAIGAIGATKIDSAILSGLSYDLYRSPDGEESWLRMQSPPLQDGSQPYYVEPVHEECVTCARALAWRAGERSIDSVEYEIET